MKSKLLAAAIVAGLPSITLAQGIEHLGSEFGLGYSSTSFDNSSDSSNGFALSIKTDWALGAAFGLQVNGTARDFDFASAQTFGLHGWYQVSPILRLGAFAQQSNYSFSGGPGSLSGRLFGLEALVEPVENASIQLYAGRGNTDLAFLGQGEVTSYGMSASYDFSSALSARISFNHGNQVITGTSVDSQTMGFGIDWRTKGFGNTPMTIAFDYADVSSWMDDGSRVSITAKIGLGGSGDKPRRLFDDRYAPVFTLVF